KTVPLATVIHTLHRAPKDVIKAQLCQEPDRLIYMLTLLGRDGKVKRAIVDATNGSVVGERKLEDLRASPRGRGRSRSQPPTGNGAHRRRLCGRSRFRR